MLQHSNRLLANFCQDGLRLCPMLYSPAVLTVGANILLAAGVVAAVMLWGFALWWLLTAISSILQTVAQGIPFNLGWWGSGGPMTKLKAVHKPANDHQYQRTWHSTCSAAEMPCWHRCDPAAVYSMQVHLEQRKCLKILKTCVIMRQPMSCTAVTDHNCHVLPRAVFKRTLNVTLSCRLSCSDPLPGAHWSDVPHRAHHPCTLCVVGCHHGVLPCVHMAVGGQPDSKQGLDRPLV